MKSTVLPAVAAAALAAAGAASATTKDFDFDLNGSVVASGSFTYTTGATGVLGYDDLSAFSVSLFGYNYSLADVEGMSDYIHFGYDTAGNDFVTATVCGFFGCQNSVMSAVKGFEEGGFFFTPIGFADHHKFDIGAYDTINIVDEGASPAAPFLPDVSSPGNFTFDNPLSDSWFDPAPAHGFTYTLASGDFTEVGAPPSSFGFGPLKVVVAGSIVDVLAPGADYSFGPGVTTFSLLGITPGVDPSSPTAFPTFLAFSGNPSALSMSAVPEPAGWALMLVGSLGLGAALRRRRRAGAVAAV
jgi:hypothetical protein